MPERYLTAQQAAEMLGVNKATLYAYVSRGFIRSESAGGPNRARRYLAEDVARLNSRKEQRRDPALAVAQALHFGQPILESAITLIDDGRFYYRGQDVLLLAQRATVETVAALLWGVESLPAGHPLPPLSLPAGSLTPIEKFQIALPLAAVQDRAAYDLRPAGVIQTGWRILRLLVQVAAGRPIGQTIAQTLQEGWLPGRPEAIPLLNAALILCADHELNVSSFTARCVASAGATPYAVVMAGLAALQGVKHGGHSERVAALFQEVSQNPTDPAGLLSARLKRGETIPGFGHPLYPAGDPRYQLLAQMLQASLPTAPAFALAQAIATAAQSLINEQPTIDLGLVTLCQCLELPAGTPLALFAIGRTIGWLGHALEQYETGRIIRPRAHYVGPLPADFQPG